MRRRQREDTTEEKDGNLRRRGGGGGDDGGGTMMRLKWWWLRLYIAVACGIKGAGRSWACFRSEKPFLILSKGFYRR